MKEKIISNLRRILSQYNIKISFVDINKIDTKNFKKELTIKKSERSINNFEFESFREVIDIIHEIQNYNKEELYKELDNKLNDLLYYYDSKTSNTENNFLEVIRLLSSSSKQSIINTEEFNDFNQYMHVERPIQRILEEKLEKMKHNEKEILFLVGSVGDGKSHLLSYINNNSPELLNDVIIHNDATESDDPTKTAVETLTENISKYFESVSKKLVIAINIGMLHNLLIYIKEKELLKTLEIAIENSGLFSENGMGQNIFTQNDISFISFTNEKNYEIENGKINSEFYNGILDKIFLKDNNNPFYKAFIKDDGYKRVEPIYLNYKLLLNKDIQSTIRFLLIKIQIENKRILTTRSVLNFIFDIIVPDETLLNINSYLPTLLFENAEKSQLLKSLSLQDPILTQSLQIDKLNIELYNAIDFEEKCLSIFAEKEYKEIKPIILLIKRLNTHKKKFEMIIRLHFLFNYELYGNEHFIKYIQVIDTIQNDKKIKKDIYIKLMKALYKWNGSPKENYIYNESLKPNTKMLMGLNINPIIKSIEPTNKMSILAVIIINQQVYEIDIDYNLFVLIEKIDSGYIIKESDKLEAVVFSKFIEDILNEIESVESTILYFPADKNKYIIKESYLGYEIGGLK